MFRNVNGAEVSTRSMSAGVIPANRRRPQRRPSPPVVDRFGSTDGSMPHKPQPVGDPLVGRALAEAGDVERALGAGVRARSALVMTTAEPTPPPRYQELQSSRRSGEAISRESQHVLDRDLALVPHRRLRVVQRPPAVLDRDARGVLRRTPNSCM